MYESPETKFTKAFNDYENFVYSNVTAFINTSGHLMPVPTHAYSFTLCGEMNPCNPDRPLRNFGQILDNLKELKSAYTRARVSFNRSGNQDGEDMEYEFYKFCQGNANLLYAFILWKHVDLGKLGKVLDINMGSDTPLPGVPATSISHTPKSRKRKNSAASDRSPNDSSDGGDVKEILRYEALKHLSTHGRSEEDKDAAYNGLLEIAGFKRGARVEEQDNL
jgi:hypothetical protein